jgi:hypothetical protein
MCQWAVRGCCDRGGQTTGVDGACGALWMPGTARMAALLASPRRAAAEHLSVMSERVSYYVGPIPLCRSRRVDHVDMLKSC